MADLSEEEEMEKLIYEFEVPATVCVTRSFPVCLIWRSLFDGGCCCQVVTQWWVIFWWMKAERSDLEGKNLGLMRGRSVARESTVS